METYRHAMAEAAPTVVLTPQSDLLKYFNLASPPK